MKKVLMILAIVLMIVPSAFAQTNIGIGWDNGYSIKIPVDPVCIQVVGKFDSIIPENDDLDAETDAEIAAYVSYPFMVFDESKLNVFGGFSLMPSTREVTVGAKTYDKEIDFGIRFGVEPAARITDNIEISAKIGLEIKIDQGYDGLNDSGNTGVGSWGGIGVHWFF